MSIISSFDEMNTPALLADKVQIKWARLLDESDVNFFSEILKKVLIEMCFFFQMEQTDGFFIDI